MRLIDADALIEHMKKDPLFSLVERYGITGVIEAAPTIDIDNDYIRGFRDGADFALNELRTAYEKRVTNLIVEGFELPVDNTDRFKPKNNISVCVYGCPQADGNARW